MKQPDFLNKKINELILLLRFILQAELIYGNA